MIKQKEKIKKLHKEAELWLSIWFYQSSPSNKEYEFSYTMISLITNLEDKVIHSILENTESCLTYMLKDTKENRLGEIKRLINRVDMKESQRKEFIKTIELIGAF